jgi:cytochrome o ubiquinol oxidase subunit 1
MVLLIVYAAFAAVTYWFPKVFGFRLDERTGKWFFASFSTGTLLLFTAMFALGFMGETRRLDYLYDTHWMPALVIEEIGVGFYTLSCVFFFAMLFVSVRDRAKNLVGDDAWGTSRTLEWMTHSPVPFYNFAVTPQVNARDELSWRYANKLAGIKPDHYVSIHMPKNTAVPMMIGVLAFGFGFGLTWRIWWMAGLSLLGMIAVVIYRSFARDKGYEISGEEMARLEGEAPLGVIADSQYLSRVPEKVGAH